MTIPSTAYGLAVLLILVIPGTVYSAVRTRHVAVLFALLVLVAGCGEVSEVDPPTPDDHVLPTPDDHVLPTSDDHVLPTPDDHVEWRTSGYEIRQVPVRPYDSDRLLDLDSRDRPVDDDGVQFYEREGERYFHPVGMAQYGIGSLLGWSKTGDEEYLRRALANGEKLLDISTESAGALWFPYSFDFRLGRGEEVILAPWWSGMAQGQALSLFVRLYEETGDEKWRDAADRTFLSFTVLRDGDAPWLLYLDDGFVWFEEYAGQTEPLRVLNGQIFAIYGLYDYFLLTGNTEGEQLFDAGVTTVKQHMDRFRVDGEYSYYCLRQDYCDASFQNQRYHFVHIHQLAMLGRMTGDQAFQEMSDLFALDAETFES